MEAMMFLWIHLWRRICYKSIPLKDTKKVIESWCGTKPIGTWPNPPKAFGLTIHNLFLHWKGCMFSYFIKWHQNPYPYSHSLHQALLSKNHLTIWLLLCFSLYINEGLKLELSLFAWHALPLVLLMLSFLFSLLDVFLLSFACFNFTFTYNFFFVLN